MARRKKNQSKLHEFCYDWGMVLLVVGAMAAWAMLPEEVGKPIGYMFLSSVVLLFLSDYLRPKARSRKR